MTHAPTPYHITPHFEIQSDGPLYIPVARARGRSEKESSANGHFILKACNNHDALVAALQGMLDSALKLMGNAGDVDEWNHGGHAYESWMQATAAITNLTKNP